MRKNEHLRDIIEVKGLWFLLRIPGTASLIFPFSWGEFPVKGRHGVHRSCRRQFAFFSMASARRLAVREPPSASPACWWQQSATTDIFLPSSKNSLMSTNRGLYIDYPRLSLITGKLETLCPGPDRGMADCKDEFLPSRAILYENIRKYQTNFIFCYACAGYGG